MRLGSIISELGNAISGPGIRPDPGPNFNNPWEQNSWAQAGVRNVEDALTGGILGANHEDPNTLRHRLFQFMVLIRDAFMREDELVKRTEANKKAEERTHNLAFPAEIARA